jgi:hypothetical protein
MNLLSKVKVSAMAVCIAILMSGCSKSPESTIEGFYYAVSEGEVSEAKSYLSSELVAKGGKKIAAGLAAQHEKFLACKGIDGIKVDMKGEGEVRFGTTTITFKGECPETTDKFKLIEENGDWKLSASK